MASSLSSTSNQNPNEDEDPFKNIVDSRSLSIAGLFLLAIAIRAAVGLHPYSGENAPPMHGDYEAQRHWMEITLNLPPTEWYVSSSNNNLSYWGLDYPPLSAYLSQAFGYYLSFVDPRSMALNTSHGYETKETRSAMRNTVLLCDAFLLFPALYLANDDQSLRMLVFNISTPALLLIDHAHFQYNGVSAALLLFCVFMLQHRRDSAAAALYSACVLFKQTNMYYGPVIACTLMSRFISILIFDKQLFNAAKYAAGITIAITFTLTAAFLPLMMETKHGNFNLNRAALAHVVKRVFPISRGLFEDKVANVWCTLSSALPHRFRPVNLIPENQLLVACAFITLTTSAPFCLAIAMRPWCMKRLKMALSGTALTAFLWSYQVHEKQILVSLVPLGLLHNDLPLITTWMSIVGALSVLPLLIREGSAGAYVACLGLHTAMAIRQLIEKRGAMLRNLSSRTVVTGYIIVLLALHMVLMGLSAPRNLPDLFILAVTCFCCSQFCIAYLLILYLISV